MNFLLQSNNYNSADIEIYRDFEEFSPIQLREESQWENDNSVVIRRFKSGHIAHYTGKKKDTFKGKRVAVCVAVCCSVLQCVAVCCSVLQFTHFFGVRKAALCCSQQ